MLDIKKESFVKLRSGEIKAVTETGVMNEFSVNEWSEYNLGTDRHFIGNERHFDYDIIAIIRPVYSQEDKAWVANHHCVKCGSLVEDAIGNIKYEVFDTKFIDKMSYKQCPECKVFICQ